MTKSVPQIGFDRFIQLEWAAVAAKVRAELATLDDVNKLLDTAGLGVAARKKTRTVLNRLWLEPRPELEDFADRGIAAFKASLWLPCPGGWPLPPTRSSAKWLNSSVGSLPCKAIAHQRKCTGG
jgi:hypothetical protein